MRRPSHGEYRKMPRVNAFAIMVSPCRFPLEDSRAHWALPLAVGSPGSPDVLLSRFHLQRRGPIGLFPAGNDLRTGLLLYSGTLYLEVVLCPLVLLLSYGPHLEYHAARRRIGAVSRRQGYRQTQERLDRGVFGPRPHLGDTLRNGVDVRPLRVLFAPSDLPLLLVATCKGQALPCACELLQIGPFFACRFRLFLG